MLKQLQHSLATRHHACTLVFNTRLAQIVKARVSVVCSLLAARGAPVSCNLSQPITPQLRMLLHMCAYH